MRFKMGWSKASTSAFLSKAEIATWKTWRLKLRSSRVGRLAIHAFAENQLRRTHHNTPYQEAGAANSRHTTNLHDNSISCHILLLGTWIMMMLILNLWACRTWYQSYTHLRSHFNRNWCAFSKSWRVFTWSKNWNYRQGETTNLIQLLLTASWFYRETPQHQEQPEGFIRGKSNNVRYHMTCCYFSNIYLPPYITNPRAAQNETTVENQESC